MDLAIVVLLCYLLGSISFGIIIAKLVKGIDIREYGSGNAGFTNVLRVVGKCPSVLVLIGDTLKGVLAVLIGYHFGDTNYAVIAGLMAMLGHAYPLFFHFRGGKAVATGLGVTLTLAPDVTLIALAVFFLTVGISRYVSLGSILASISVPLMMLVLHKPLPIFLFGLIGAAVVLYRHKTNIVRLYQGTESKIGQKPDDGGVK